MSRAALSLTFLMFLAACAQKPSSADDTMASSAEAFQLSPGEIDRLKATATAGDTDAAFRLGEYFSFVKRDRAEAIRWFEIPAKAGNYNAMNALVHAYIGVNTESACMQAASWLGKTLDAAPETYIAENHLAQLRQRLRWDGVQCQH